MTVDPRAALDIYAAETAVEIGAYAGERTAKIGTVPVNRMEQAPKAFAALRAVLDLHQAFQYGDEEEEFDDASRRWCRECTGGDQWRRAAWPCPTVRAMTTALEAS